jgi:hypothetical protein
MEKMMDKKIKDGGPAFPTVVTNTSRVEIIGLEGEVIGPRQIAEYNGMTKREYFAAHAPFSIDDAVALHGDRDILKKLVQIRIEYADRMLAALNRPDDMVMCRACAGVGINNQVTCTRCDGYGMVPA